MPRRSLCFVTLCACSNFSSSGDQLFSPVDTSAPVAMGPGPAMSSGVGGGRGGVDGQPSPVSMEGPSPNVPLEDAGSSIELPSNSAATDAGAGTNENPADPLVDAGDDPTQPPPPLPPGTIRFVRLVGNSEVLGRDVACISDFNLVNADGQTLDRALWRASADSEEPTYVGGAPASQAIDADPLSLWHTAWFELDPDPGYPHFLQVDLGGLHQIEAFRYLPRQDSSAGRIADYQFFVSLDGISWGQPVAAGTFPNNPAEQTVPVIID